MDELEMQEEERVKNRVDRILLGIKPMDPNTDLRTTPTIDATPHQEPKGILEKLEMESAVRQKAFQTPPKAGRIIDSKT